MKQKKQTKKQRKWNESGFNRGNTKRYKNQNILIPALIQLDANCKHNSITWTNLLLLTFIYNLIRIKTNYKDNNNNNNNNNNIAERNQYQISSCKHR